MPYKNKKSFLKSGMTTADFLEIAKFIAEKYKLNPDYLKLSDDKKHKLEYNGVKFGGFNNLDFIQYLYKYTLGEINKVDLLKHRARYLARATKIKGNWKDDPQSPNNLAIKILWLG